MSMNYHCGAIVRHYAFTCYENDLFSRKFCGDECSYHWVKRNPWTDQILNGPCYLHIHTLNLSIKFKAFLLLAKKIQDKISF